MTQTYETVNLPASGADVLDVLKAIAAGIGVEAPARLPNGATGARLRLTAIEQLHVYMRDGRLCYESYTRVPDLPGGVIEALDEDEAAQLIEASYTRYVPVEQS